MNPQFMSFQGDQRGKQKQFCSRLRQYRVLEREDHQNTPAPKRVYKKKKPALDDTSSSDSILTSDEDNDSSKEYRDRQKQIYCGMRKIRQNMQKNLAVE